ncbi:MAG: polyprenyl synthetase family protein [Actinomycetota bacterium]
MEPLSRDEVSSALESISDELRRIEQIMVEASVGATSFLTESATYLTRAGGKRLRPALTVLCSRLGTGGPNEDVFKTAGAIELVHLATLYHDDVIDEADARRGVPSANQKWGNKVAILAGDHLFARASGLAAEVGSRVSITLADAIAKVVAGQVAELQSTYDPKRTEENYLETIYGKTASLVQACAQLGSELGGASGEVREAMVRFGAAFGYAFQVADDLLDLVASREELGKPPGTDLRDGVYTLPVIFACAAQPTLRELLGTPKVDVEAMRSEVIRTGGYDYAMSVAHEYIDRALTALKETPDGAARDTLETLTRLVVERVPSR